MKKIYVLVIFALVVLNVFLWGVLVINNLNEKNNRLNETTTYKKQPKVKNNGIKKTDSKISKPKVAITFGFDIFESVFLIPLFLTFGCFL